MAKNIFANVLGRIWSIFSNIICVPLYIGILGFESYSIINIVLFISTFIGILDLGLSSTLSRELARSDIEKINKTTNFHTLESLYFLITIISIIVILFLSHFGNIFDNKSKFSESIGFYLKIVSIDLAFQMLMRFYISGLIGLEKQVKANLIQIIWGFFHNIFPIFIIFKFPRLDYLFFIQSFTTIIFAFLFRKFIYEELGLHASIIKKYSINYKYIRSIIPFVSGMFFISIISVLNTQFDKIFISQLLNIYEFGYYSLAVTVSNGILLMITPLTIALQPRFTSLFSINYREEVSTLYLKSIYYTGLIISTTTPIFAIFSKELLWVWTSDKLISEKTHIILSILIISYSAIALQAIPFSISIANRKTKINNTIGLISIIASFFGYYFVPKKFGVYGVAIVFLFVQLITMLTYFIVIDRFIIMSLNIIHFFIKSILFPFILSLFIVFVSKNIYLFYSIDGRFETLLFILLLFIILLFFNYFSFISKEKRSYVQKALYYFLKNR